MTREEQILKLIDKKTGIDNYGSTTYQIGVCDGVRLADETLIESLWHNANEEPKWNELLLGEDSEGFSIYKWVGQEDCWYTFVDVCGLNHWAYVKDLYPKGGKK